MKFWNRFQIFNTQYLQNSLSVKENLSRKLIIKILNQSINNIWEHEITTNKIMLLLVISFYQLRTKEIVAFI